MTSAHGDNNSVGLKLNVFDICKSLSNYRHESWNVKAGRALVKTCCKNTECCLSEWKCIIYSVFEWAKINLSLHVELSKLIYLRKDLLLH
mmetsp:Transcript_36282/g.76467  ORF Transcript_36282/g.76467 Transcript_36282/m.76467 type:complete len:90 (-) Transcript_36282:1837-2106(-)